MKKRMYLESYCTRVLLVGLCLLLLAAPALGQGATSSVRGAVTDPQGNVVAGATVTLTSAGTNQVRTATTSDNGTYSFELIQVGDYSLEVEAKGFKKGQVTGIHALLAKATTADVTLEIGNVTETVTVASSAETLTNRDDGSLGNNFINKQITQLPSEARNVASFLTLQPAVTRDGYVAGARSDQSNVTLDGVDINEAQYNQIGSVSSNNVTPDSNTVLRLSAEAIEEFRVTTINSNALAGRSSGAQVAVTTKSGTNNLHGAAFWFHRPTILSANDFFNNRSGVKKPSLIRNTFGGAIGGPIIKNRLFFFYSYDGRRDASQTTVLRTVPLPSMGRGELRFTNPSGGITTLTAANFQTIFPALNGQNPVAVAALAAAAAKYPANDFGTTGDSLPGQLLNTAGYRFNAQLPVKLNGHSGKFDLNLTDRHSMFARVNIQHDVIAGVPAFPDTPSPDVWSHPWGVALGDTWSISNNLVNHFNYGLTREAFTTQGDASKNEIYFRFIFFPVLDSRSLTRVTPTHNFTDDLSWIRGNHTMQYGTNIRIIRNKRTTFANAFDTAYTNPSYYQSSGTIISNTIGAFSPLGAGQSTVVQNAATALIGRLSTYTARFTFDKGGKLLPSGTPTEREFATEEYDFYGQDAWKIQPNLTLTFGLRYGLSRPIYEMQGYEAAPSIPLGEYFERRLAAAKLGQNYTQTLTVDLSGPKNGKPYMYPWDRNNFQPRIALAYSPNFRDGFMGKLFGENGKSVIRSGFAVTNDYIGQQLAVRFDLANSLGFVSSQTSPTNNCNFTTRICPLFTGYAQDVRSLAGVIVPGSQTFPQQKPADFTLRIETGLDSKIVSPINYSWNLTFERQLPKGLLIQTSYLGRFGRNLLAARDVMMPNNLVDPKSGMDWYSAGGLLEDIRRNFASQGINSSSSAAVLQAALATVGPIPFFENFFGAVPNFARNMLGASRASWATNATQAVLGDALIFNGPDWTTTQADIDGSLDAAGLGLLFYQPQYGALSSFSTIANSDYHAGTISVRERLGNSLTMDFNYTFSKSMDDASGLQSSGSYGSAFILNPIRQSDNRSVSDFDIRHIINMNTLWQLPVGRGRWLNTQNSLLNAVAGGWQMSSIFRWNSGPPINAPFDAATWSTNWNAQSNGVRTRPVETCATRGGLDAPALFGCDRTAAYRSFRNAKPGETGDRNVFRTPGYVVLDMGMSKSFTMPWHEGHKLDLRFEAFNVTNTQRMGALVGGRTGYGLVIDPQVATPPPNWSNFGAIQGDRRVMQFGFRYEF